MHNLQKNTSKLLVKNLGCYLNIIKLDVEGFEFEFMKGISKIF